MKQMLKKMGVGFLVAIFLTVNILPTLGTFAEAAETGSITIENPEPEKSYDIYQIFDLTYSGTGEGEDKKNVSYTIAQGWDAFFTTDPGKKYLVEDTKENRELNPIVVGGETKRIKIKTEDEVSDFAAAASAFAVKNDIPKINVTAGKTDTTVTKSGLKLGYYLVYPKGAVKKKGQKSIVSLTSTLPDAKVQIKGTYPTIKKTANRKTADYGEDITYTITGEVPDTTDYATYIYTITDTLSEGLTLNEKSVKVEIGGVDKTTDGNIEYVEKDPATGKLKINFNMRNLQTLKGQEIKVTYTAKLNEKAVIGKDGNTNKAQLTYSNDPKDSDKKETTPGETFSVYTGSITIDKHDGKDESKKLSGAKFILKNAEDKYYKYDATAQKVLWVAEGEADTVTTGDTGEVGKAEFKGIKDGTYHLIETEAPKGYNKLTAEVEVTVGDKEGEKREAVADVENNTGSELPGTGGMGAKIFIIIGGGIGLLAAGMYRRNRKMNAGNR